MPSNGFSSHNGEAYDLGALVDEYPLNTRGMIYMLFYLLAFGAPIIIYGINLWLTDFRLLEELTAANLFLDIFLVVFTLILIYTVIQVIIQGKPWQMILNPQPGLYSKIKVGHIILIIAAAALILFRPGIGMLVVGGASILWALGFVLTRMQRLHGQVIREFEQGIVVPVDGKPIPIRWEQIDTISWQGSEGRIGGHNFPLVEIESHWINANRLLGHIQSKVHQRLYDDMLEHFNAGKVVNFGKIKLDRQGISCGTTSYTWQEIDQVCVTSTGVSVRQGSRMRQLPGVTIKDIPNFNSFITLTSHILSSPKTEAEALPTLEAPPPAPPPETGREYRFDPLQLLTPVLMLFMGAVMLIPILFALSQGVTDNVPMSFVLIGGAVILVALLKVVALSQSTGVRVHLSEDALTYTRAGETLTLYWEDVQTIKVFYVRSWRTMLVYRYTLVSKTGRVIHLRQGLKDMDSIGDYIAKRLNAILSPQLAKRVEGGELVRFGRWGISQQGIHDRDRVLPWDEVGGITVKSRAALVKQKGNPKLWTRIPIMGTPNAWIFLNLLGQYVQYELPSYRVS